MSAPSSGTGINRSTVALLIGVAAFALVFAVVLGFLHGPFIFGSTDDKPQATSFEFQEMTVDVADNETHRGIVVTYQSGTDFPQGAVTIEVNGKQAFDVDQESDIRRPWNDSEATLSNESTRVVVYGDGSDSAENGTDTERATIENGDIVEVVWQEPDGNRTNVLQRYVVDG